MMEPDELVRRRERDLTREPARAREAESRLEGGRPRERREPDLDVDGTAATDTLAAAALTERQSGRPNGVEQRRRQFVVVGDDVRHVEDDPPRRGEELDRHADRVWPNLAARALRISRLRARERGAPRAAEPAGASVRGVLGPPRGAVEAKKNEGPVLANGPFLSSGDGI
jgi:hypothetical protein